MLCVKDKMYRFDSLIANDVMIILFHDGGSDTVKNA